MVRTEGRHTLGCRATVKTRFSRDPASTFESHRTEHLALLAHVHGHCHAAFG